MEFDKTITPEQQWEKIKSLIFKDKAPNNLDEMMNKGFDESKSENEKWEKLAAFMVMVKERFG